MTQDIAKAGVVLLSRMTDGPIRGQCFSNNEMRTIIAALSLLEPVAAGTHVIVPVEPTEAMLNEGSDAFSIQHQNVCYPKIMDIEGTISAKRIYRAMIAAAGKL